MKPIRKSLQLTLFVIALALVFAGGCQRRAANSAMPNPALGSGEHDFFMTHDGLQRKYKVYIPESYAGNTPAPLVIYLHGGGANNKYMYADGLDKYSEKFGFILAAPNGTGKLPNKLLTWNSGSWSGGECCGPAVEKNADDVGFISKMLDEIKTKLNIDGRRVYVTGISNGGMMTYRLACELADRIAAAAPVSPPAVPQDCAPARPISIMHIHGTSDACTPYYGGPGGGCLFDTPPIFIAQSAQEMIDIWVEKDAVSTTPAATYQNGKATCVSYPGENGIEVEFCTIEGGGHTWVGGNPRLPEEQVGSASHDISFEQIWEFFSRHQLP